MIPGRSIRLFLVDGTPTGLLTAEIMNWTGHVLTGPRSRLSELIKRPEAGRTGIYFLVGPDPDNAFRSQVYIGESDDVARRLKQHNRPEEQGGKDFWERVCLVTSKDQNLTKAHVKHLESLLIGNAKTVNRCGLTNGTAHEYIALPESDLADMAFFAEQIRTVLPVLGFDFLRDNRRSIAELAPQDSPPERSPVFVAQLPKYGISARAQEVGGEFHVLQGSLARAEWSGPKQSYSGLHQQLVSDGVLRANDAETRVFEQDYSFNSPSAAAAVVFGRSANGRKHWQLESSGQTYGDWQDEQVTATLPSGDEPS